MSYPVWLIETCKFGDVESVIFCRFSNADNFRPEVPTDVISGAVEEPTGMKVQEKFMIVCQTILEIYDCLTL